MGPFVAGVYTFQGLGDAGVQPDLSAGGQLPGQCLLHHGVAELITFDQPVAFLYKMGSDRLVDGLQHLVLGNFCAQRPQQPEIKLPADDRSRSQHLDADFRQPGQPLVDHLPHPLGNA